MSKELDFSGIQQYLGSVIGTLSLPDVMEEINKNYGQGEAASAFNGQLNSLPISELQQAIADIANAKKTFNAELDNMKMQFVERIGELAIAEDTKDRSNKDGE